MATGIDPVTLEVVRGSLVSTVLQMRATLVRTAYAPILWESKDFSCGLISAGGELCAMSEDFSGHVFAMALGLAAARAKFNDEINPGDVLVVNDPYTGGTHMNDIAFYSPFFVDGRILLYIGVRAHWADVGGANPGSFSGQDTEIYQEGVRIVPVKLIEGGELNRGLWDVLFANMRLPDEQEGNAMAMLDTVRVAEMGIEELCGRYGPDTVAKCIEALLDGAEEVMRGRIAQLPDGEYHYEQYADNSGLSPEPMPIKVRLSVRGEEMHFDFTGTNPQVVAPMNAGEPVTKGGVYVILKSWLDPKSPVNGGSFRPVSFVIPEQSCLAAQLPAAVGGCWEIFRQVQSAVIGLLDQIIPDSVGAENEGAVQHMYVVGYDPVRGKPYILYEAPHAGTPATSETDGATACMLYDGGDIPTVRQAESVEQREPLLIESLEVPTDWEGPGKFRSGFGISRRIRVVSDTSMLSVMTDRSVIPPWGAAGAPAGALNTCTVIRDGAEIEPSQLPGKVKAFPLRKGDVVFVRGCAGGGVGDPLERDVDLVRKDVYEGYTSRRRAIDVYGVVIENGAVDLAGTRAKRQELREHRRLFEVTEATEDDFNEVGCRLSRLSPAAAALLGVRDGDIVEHSGRSAVPLRAWVRVAENLPRDGVIVGPIGRSILGVAPGDKIWVRKLEVRTPGPSRLV